MSAAGHFQRPPLASYTTAQKRVLLLASASFSFSLGEVEGGAAACVGKEREQGRAGRAQRQAVRPDRRCIWLVHTAASPAAAPCILQLAARGDCGPTEAAIGQRNQVLLEELGWGVERGMGQQHP